MQNEEDKKVASTEVPGVVSSKSTIKRKDSLLDKIEGVSHMGLKREI